MKTFKTLILTLCLFGFANLAQAQFRIGPLVAFGTDTDLGLGAKAKFDLNEQFKISPSFIFLASNSENTVLGKVSSTIFEINGDVHYAFSDNGNVMFYGLGGLNIVAASVKIFGESVSTTDIGLNLGAGGEFVVADKFNAFAEAKFGLGGAEQLLISAGIYFTLGE
jgi:hypothetical protein